MAWRTPQCVLRAVPAESGGSWMDRRVVVALGIVAVLALLIAFFT